MTQGVPEEGASGGARNWTGNRSTEPRVGSSNLSGRALSEAVDELARASLTAARVSRLIRRNARVIAAASRGATS